jgi:Zn-dependent hydrolases, including glyoxylases
MAPVFLTEESPTYGVVQYVSPMVRRIVAKNPSKFTYHGTGTYIIGDPDGNELAVIDPGPRDDKHLAALLDSIGNKNVSHILVTHTHPDHSPAAISLAEITSAPTYGFGKHPLAASQKSDDLDGAQQDDLEDRGDTDFVPDVEIGNGDVIVGEGFTFEALHTPGHISNHLCFSLEEESTLFTGDHVMGWSTTVIPAPDGNLSHYLSNLRRLLERSEMIYRPTHGPAIEDPLPFVNSLIEHREKRTTQIIAAIKTEPKTVQK